MQLMSAIPISLQAGLWGLVSGSALMIGAAVGWFVPLGRFLAPARLLYSRA